MVPLAVIILTVGMAPATSTRPDVPSCATDSTFRRSPVRAVINPRREQVGGHSRILIDLDLTNESRAVVWLERWLALDPATITTPLFRVFDADGGPVRYVGKHLKRVPPKRGEGVRLRPRETRKLVGIDLTDVYAFASTSQTFTMKYDVLSVARTGALESIESPCVKLAAAGPVQVKGFPRGR
jgi:hypothetical protein